MQDILEVGIGEKTYPRLLAEIKGRPEKLYLRGSVAILERPLVAVVGSRQATESARQKTRLIVAELVGAGKVVVSGLARGVDGMAHEAALGTGGLTVAVLAHGLDMVYPREHERLAERIIAGGGAVISELEVGVQPRKNYFLERNRIIVGMSEFLVVVEAQLRSGSLASASLAAEMGREVLAVPGSPGTDLLISEGATALEI